MAAAPFLQPYTQSISDADIALAALRVRDRDSVQRTEATTNGSALRRLRLSWLAFLPMGPSLARVVRWALRRPRPGLLSLTSMILPLQQLRLAPTSPSSSPTPSSSNAHSPRPQDPLDPLSANFLSDLGYRTDILCAWLTGVGIALNCRMLLGFSGYQEYEIASRLNACAIDFTSVHRVVAQACGKYRRVRAWSLDIIWGMLTCLVVCPYAYPEAKEGFARILIQPDPTLVRTPTVPALEYDSAPPLDPAALMGRLEGPYPAPVHELQQLNQPMVMNPSSRPLVHYAAATSLCHSGHSSCIGADSQSSFGRWWYSGYG